jgi:2-keto-3-deoxy-L-rhamnonate aldolase RhmA
LVELTNPLRARLAAGKIAAGMGAKLIGGVEIASLMRTAGFDWLFIDLEHGKLSVESACDLATASLAVGIAPIVRIPARQYWLGARLLDGGALGIVVPHVDTAEEARAIVDAFRFPPLGHRSMSGNYPHFGFAGVPSAAATQMLDAATFLIAMIETPAAVDAAESIASVLGLDALLVGCSDLSAEMGIPGEVGHDRIANALERVVGACRKHGKTPGFGGAYAEPLLRRYTGLGMRLVLSGNDASILVEAAKARSDLVRSCGG